MLFEILIANVSTACVMAALSTVKEAIKKNQFDIAKTKEKLIFSSQILQVNTKICDTIVIGTQLGLLGCLSTVSTFAGVQCNERKQSSLKSLCVCHYHNVCLICLWNLDLLCTCLGNGI
ncbi:hypothetical protein Ahy_A09g044719 [Arachis hypogaea]|uniref:Uncharacterized protein n=1 Tax=Arachis hypogaea TaxID=3818 RepID=A0A445BKN0_ARAHY|nr:hypothetical protein Ahy_A09g044719 [Arachis hypogaea]